MAKINKITITEDALLKYGFINESCPDYEEKGYYNVYTLEDADIWIIRNSEGYHFATEYDSNLTIHYRINSINQIKNIYFAFTNKKMLLKRTQP